MRILGIETSCDETAVAMAAVDEAGACRIIAEDLSSQIEIHSAYGGVVPELASRAHLENLPLLVDAILSRSGGNRREVRAIGVTQGPGLKGCLLVGLSFAKGLALAWDVPLVGVNHIEGHLLAPMLDNPELQFPFLALIVSGGHTEIVIARELGRYELVARTSDDAAGEAFDKSANLLGFDYPGGPALARLADTVQESSFSLPKVMRARQGISFSGLKTAISLLTAAQLDLSQNQSTRAQLAHTIQGAIVDALVYKLAEAVSETGIATVVVTGGVSANRLLRERVGSLHGVRAYFPSREHCMDNAAMIAYTAALRIQTGERLPLESEAVSRWPVENLRP